MKYHLSVHHLLVASLVLAPAAAATKESSKANKMMSMNELEKSMSLHYGSKSSKTELYNTATSPSQGKSSKLNSSDESGIAGKATKIEDGISLSMDSKSVKGASHTATPGTTGKASKIEDGISLSMNSKAEKSVPHSASSSGTTNKGAKSEKGVALSMDSKSSKSISHNTTAEAAILIEEADEFWIEYETKTGKEPSGLDGKSAKSKAAKDSEGMSMEGMILSVDNSKGGKEPSKAAKEFDGISMQGSALSMDYMSKSGKIGKASDSVDSKAFKTSIHGPSFSADAIAKTSKSDNVVLTKSGKSLSLSLEYAESHMPSESPSVQPSAAALTRKLICLKMFCQTKLLHHHFCFSRLYHSRNRNSNC